MEQDISNVDHFQKVGTLMYRCRHLFRNFLHLGLFTLYTFTKTSCVFKNLKSLTFCQIKPNILPAGPKVRCTCFQIREMASIVLRLPRCLCALLVWQYFACAFAPELDINFLLFSVCAYG